MKQIYQNFCCTSLLFLSLGSVSAFGNEVSTSVDYLDKDPELDVSFELGWESRYFSEGRDNLDGDSIIVSTFELNWKNLSAGVWYAYSPDQRYDEL